MPTKRTTTDEIRAQYGYLPGEVLDRLSGLIGDMVWARNALADIDDAIEADGGTFKSINDRKKYNPLNIERQRLASHANYLLDRMERIARGAEAEEDDGLGEFE